MKNQIIIGLTGPIASGKDVVAKIFARHGAVIIDADDVGHKIIAPQSKVWHKLVKTFGAKILNKGGKVNRKKLGAIVFSDQNALKKLDQIMHPEMRKIISGRIKEAIRKNKKIIIVNAALLQEMKLIPLVDKVIVVLAKKEISIKRLIKAGRSKAEALARICMQKGDASYRKMADIVITNNKTISDLKEKVNSIHSSM
jgi:dephospho-CoA kinase